MNLPSGLVFYLDFKYGDQKLGSKRSAGDNMYGNVSTANDKMAIDEDVSGGLYGGGSFGYSIQSQSLGNLEPSAVAATSSSVAYDSQFIPSHFNTYTVDLTGQDADLNGVRAFRLLSGSADVTSHPELTSVSGNNVTFVVSKSVAEGNFGTNDGTVIFQKQPQDNSRALWTPEFAQDLNAYHSIDAEAELTSLLSEYISMEIDLEILDMLIQGAVTTEKWSAKSNKLNKNFLF